MGWAGERPAAKRGWKRLWFLGRGQMGLEVGRSEGLRRSAAAVVRRGVLGAGEVAEPCEGAPGIGSGKFAGCVGAIDASAGVADPEEARVVGAMDLVSLEGKAR